MAYGKATISSNLSMAFIDGRHRFNTYILVFQAAICEMEVEGGIITPTNGMISRKCKENEIHSSQANYSIYSDAQNYHEPY